MVMRLRAIVWQLKRIENLYEEEELKKSVLGIAFIIEAVGIWTS
jgi:hypothetical protein